MGKAPPWEVVSKKRQVVAFDCASAGFVPEQAEGLGPYVNVRVAGGEGVCLNCDSGGFRRWAVIWPEPGALSCRPLADMPRS